MYFPLEKLNCGKNGSWITAPKAGSVQAAVVTQTSQTKPGLFGPGFYPEHRINCFPHFGSSRLLWESGRSLGEKYKTKTNVRISSSYFWPLGCSVARCMACPVSILREKIGPWPPTYATPSPKVHLGLQGHGCAFESAVVGVCQP